MNLERAILLTRMKAGESMASLNVDPLKLYFGGQYPINEDFIIHQPTVGEIMEYGENDFYQMLYVFIGNTTMRKLELWDLGVSWTALSDYELFCTLVQAYPVEKTKILFGDGIDFTKFKMYGIEHTDEQNAEFEKQYSEWEQEHQKMSDVNKKRQKIFRRFEFDNTFYNAQNGIELSAKTYHQIADVLRAMFGIFPKTEYINSKSGRELVIEEQRNLRKQEQNDDGKVPSSTLLPLISGCVNHPGFKYNVAQLKDLGIYAFMDSVQRLQVYQNTRSLLNGAYSGFADMSKVPKEEFDFMREIKN